VHWECQQRPPVPDAAVPGVRVRPHPYTSGPHLRESPSNRIIDAISSPAQLHQCTCNPFHCRTSGTMALVEAAWKEGSAAVLRHTSY
jgi:hypothetical protein